MAKGRKLTTSRSERFFGYSYGHSHQPADDSPELGEEDVWSMVDDMVNGDDHSGNGLLGEWSSRSNSESQNGSSSIRSRRRVPQDDRHAGGLSLSFDDPSKTTSPRIIHRGQNSLASPRGPLGPHLATSAPLNVPDWTKIYRVDSVELIHDSDDSNDDHDSGMVPPHEYLARECSRSRKMAADSVFEGIGRTLKGRDMSRVREAVWSQTGFDG